MWVRLKLDPTYESRCIPLAPVGCDDSTAELAGECVRVFLDHTVDEHVLEAFRHLVRLEVGGDVSHLGGIEDEHVCPGAWTQYAAIFQAEDGRGQTGHRSHGEWQIDHSALIHVDAYLAGEGSV